MLRDEREGLTVFSGKNTSCEVSSKRMDKILKVKQVWILLLLSLFLLYYYDLVIEVLSRFFDRVGHKTTYVSSHGQSEVHDLVEISIFSLNDVTVKLTKKYEQPPRTSQNFSVLKIDWIFQKKNSLKDIGLGDQLKKMFLKILIFKILYFLRMCPIFVGSVHHFDRSENII